MNLYDDPSTVATPPPLPAAGTPGYLADGAPGTQPRSVLRAWIVQAVISEIVGVITGAGITPDRTNNTQLLAAIVALIADAGIGFTPVQQGGGTGQGTNKLRLGWDAAGTGLRLQVDGSDFGQLALKTDLTAAINALIGGAPGALDTLKELADAINDDTSYASTVTLALAGKQPNLSPPSSSAGSYTKLVASVNGSGVVTGLSSGPSTIAQVLSSSGTFTVPAGIYSLEVELWGGGGGSAGGATGTGAAGGGGGAAGGYGRQIIATTPGVTFAYSQGSAGSAGAAAANGGAGGSTSFGAYTATGGAAGVASSDAASQGGGANTTLSISGGYGEGALTGVAGEGGRGGSSPRGGAGGGQSQSGIGLGGIAPGGGAGGGYAGVAGGAGAAGLILLTY